MPTRVSRSSGAALPDEAFAAALASLPGFGPARLAELLRERSPSRAWDDVLAGRHRTALGLARRSTEEQRVDEAASLARRWRAAAEAIDVADLWERHRRTGVSVHLHGAEGYPEALLDDIEPPPVLFSAGDLGALDDLGRRVAIVGTRRCTHEGRSVALELGRDLSVAGVSVVSGLALGIDAAAHRGALLGEAPPIAVVGSGLDVTYPRANADLWAEVRERGVLLSEAPLGARPEAWRFPARNRLLAALSKVVVVVESAATGGSMLTVGEAEKRQRRIAAVPGPVRSPASAGTNRLIADGGAVVLDAVDVLVLLGLVEAGPSPRRRRIDRRPLPGEQERMVLDAVGWSPASTEDVLARTALSPSLAATLLGRLEVAGWVRGEAGWWQRLPG